MMGQYDENECTKKGNVSEDCMESCKKMTWAYKGMEYERKGNEWKKNELKPRTSQLELSKSQSHGIIIRKK